jgi:hypothetical protein
MTSNRSVHTVSDHVSLWIDPVGSSHIKTNDPYGDPVELTEEDAEELATILTKLVHELRHGSTAPT